MRSIGVRATASCLAIYAALSIAPVQAADLIWEVESPFRLFKPTASFDMHERAFKAVRGDPSSPLPNDIIWRVERKLNDPDCKDSSSPNACAATPRARYEQSRLGWAAQTLSTICYDQVARPRRYPPHMRAQILVGNGEGRLHPAGRPTRFVSSSHRKRSRAPRPATAHGAGSRVPAADRAESRSSGLQGPS